MTRPALLEEFLPTQLPQAKRAVTEHIQGVVHA